MIFITSYRKLHLSGNFWTFKTQSTQYDYIFVENYIYKKLKEAAEIYKKQTKKQKVLAEVTKYIFYVLPNVMLLEAVSFFVINQTDDECPIFFTLHSTVCTSFSPSLLIWQMSTRIINQFRLLLPLK